MPLGKLRAVEIACKRHADINPEIRKSSSLSVGCHNWGLLVCNKGLKIEIPLN